MNSVFLAKSNKNKTGLLKKGSSKHSVDTDCLGFFFFFYINIEKKRGARFGMKPAAADHSLYKDDKSHCLHI